MHGPINVKSPNNTSKLQMGFNSAFKGLNWLEIFNEIHINSLVIGTGTILFTRNLTLFL
jgi:hypothetical protein